MISSFEINFFKQLFKFSIILGIFCFGSAMAQTPSTANEFLKNAEKKLVAKLDGENIYLSEILEMAKQLPREYQKLSLDTVFPSLLSRAIDARLVRNAGIKKGFSTDPEVKKRLKEIEGQIVSEVFLKKTISSQITEAALQKLYAETKSEMAVRMHPWMPLAKEREIPLSTDWVVTMFTPVEKVLKMYKEDVLKTYGKDNEQTDTTDSSNISTEPGLTD